MEGKTHYERVVGGTEEERSLALKGLQERFDERDERFVEHEIEKTPEDLEIIKKTENLVDEMVAQYGGNPKELPTDHIYILNPGSILSITNGRFSGGLHDPMGLSIGVEKEKSKLLFASTIAHELLHLKSYKAARINKSKEGIHLYRSGISMFDKKKPEEKIGKEKEYFSMLEEAIVAECAKKIIDKINKDPMFLEETMAMDRLRNWIVKYYRRDGVPEQEIEEFEKELKYISNPKKRVEQVLKSYDSEEDRQAYTAGMFHYLYKKYDAQTLERYKERKKLYELLDKLVANSNGKFKNRDEIFDEFAKANFSGKYFSITKTVESILGEGSFRKIAEEFSISPKENNSQNPTT